MIYASIDIETTGLDQDYDQVLQIAAVIDGPDFLNHRIEALPYFNVVIQHDRLYGQPAALAMNASLLARIGKGDRVETPAQASCGLEQFLRDHLDDGRITAAGKNFASFDRQFLRRFCPLAMKLVHHRSIDPGTMYAHPADRCPPGTEECFNRMNDAQARVGFSPVPAWTQHDALSDARMVVRLIRSKWGGRMD